MGRCFTEVLYGLGQLSQTSNRTKTCPVINMFCLELELEYTEMVTLVVVKVPSSATQKLTKTAVGILQNVWLAFLSKTGCLPT